MSLDIDGPGALRDVALPANENEIHKNGACDAIVELHDAVVRIAMDGDGSLWLAGRTDFRSVVGAKNGRGTLVWVPDGDRAGHPPTVTVNGPGGVRMGTEGEVRRRRQQG